MQQSWQETLEDLKKQVFNNDYWKLKVKRDEDSVQQVLLHPYRRTTLLSKAIQVKDKLL